MFDKLKVIARSELVSMSLEMAIDTTVVLTSVAVMAASMYMIKESAQHITKNIVQIFK